MSVCECGHGPQSHSASGWCFALRRERMCSCWSYREVVPSEFLLARIAEEEAAARIAQRTPEAAMNITRWHPARVLAECAAKRRIVELAENPPYSGGYGDGMWGAMRILASVYADHPDYNPAWGEQP